MENKELVDKISKRLGRNMDTVAIPGFGNFEAKKKAERVVLNPSNGKRMLVPPKIVLNFKVSNVLKNKLR